MKSIKLIRAMGNISDSFIEEAADPIKTGDGDFQEAVEISAPKRKIRLFPFLSFAALLAVTIAAVFIAQTVILNKPLDINDLLSSHGEITEVGILISDNVNVDDKEAPEYVKELKKGIGELFANTRHTISDGVPKLSEQPEEEEYVLFLHFSDTECIRVFLYEDVYYIIEKDNTAYGCRGDNADYERLMELVKNYASILKDELKVTAELDGYKAEQVIEYMVFVLNVTFPNGETAEVRTELGDFGDLDHQIQMSASPETEIFKLEHNGKTEYVIMQKVGYEEDNIKVIFFGCDEENHKLIRYKSYDANMTAFTVSEAFTQGEEGNIFYDSKLEQKLGFNLETRTADLTEYFSWERETPEIVFSDIEEHFNIEKLNLDPQADISGIIEGSLLYYYQREIVSENSENRITGRIVEENMTTGAKRTIIEGTSENCPVYYPICVYNGNLYFYMSGDDYYSSIWKINLNDYSTKLLCEASKYYEQFGQCGNYVVAENGFYFCDGLGENNKVYYLNFLDDSISIELDAAEGLYRYKNGIVYSIGKDVFYRGDDDLYCIETLENGDKKLFTLDNPRECFYEYIYCSGEYLAVSKPYDTYSAWWHDGGTAIMLYDDKEGLKPLAKIDGCCLLRTDLDGCGGDEILKLNGIFCDIKDNLFFDMPFSYEPPGYDYEIRYNYSDGKIYYMTYNYGPTEIESVLQRENAEFYCLAPK